MKKLTLVFVITFGVVFEHSCMAVITCPTGNIVFIHEDTSTDTDEILDKYYDQTEGTFRLEEKNTLSAPYAFNIAVSNNVVGQNGYLQFSNNNCFVCGDNTEVDLGDGYTFSNGQLAGARDKNGRFTYLFQCVIPQWKGWGRGYTTKHAFWIKKSIKVITTQCNNGYSDIPKEPQKNGGKAYHFIGLDIKRNMLGEALPNGYIGNINSRACYYYYCDDDYEYVARKNTCMNTEKRNLARETIPELEKLAKEATDPTRKAYMQAKIKEIKELYGLD